MYAYKSDNNDVFVQSENNPNIENWTWYMDQWSQHELVESEKKTLAAEQHPDSIF